MSTKSIDKSSMISLRRMIYSNSKRLLFDSEILYKSGSFPSSVFLSITSIEEAGKLYDVLVAYNENEFDFNRFYKRFTKHDLKHLSSFTKAITDLAYTSKDNKVSKRVSRFWELVADRVPKRNKGQKQTKLMEIRNDSIYADIDINDNRLIDPTIQIRKKDAFFFLLTAYEVLISQVETAYGHFWIDESENIDISKMKREKELLTKRFEDLQKQ